jgi:hypothetical protein
MGFEIFIYILRWITKLIGKICDLPGGKFVIYLEVTLWPVPKITYKVALRAQYGIKELLNLFVCILGRLYFLFVLRLFGGEFFGGNSSFNLW